MSTISRVYSFVRIPALALSLITHFAAPSYAADDRVNCCGLTHEALEARKAKALAAEAAKQAKLDAAVKGTGTTVPATTNAR